MKRTLVEWIPYESLDSPAGPLPPAPLLQVVLLAGGSTLTAPGLVDSGSETSCLPPHIAKRLELQIEGEARPVEVLGAIVHVRSAFCDVKVPTAFGLLAFRNVEFAVPVEDRGTDVVVLGQRPLFQELEIRFQGWRRRFGLQARGPSAASASEPPVRGPPRVAAVGRARRALPTATGPPSRAPRPPHTPFPEGSTKRSIVRMEMDKRVSPHAPRTAEC